MCRKGLEPTQTPDFSAPEEEAGWKQEVNYSHHESWQHLTQMFSWITELLSREIIHQHYTYTADDNYLQHLFNPNISLKGPDFHKENSFNLMTFLSDKVAYLVLCVFTGVRSGLDSDLYLHVCVCFAC